MTAITNLIIVMLPVVIMELASLPSNTNRKQNDT
jgi:hypothetical protein